MRILMVNRIAITIYKVMAMRLEGIRFIGGKQVAFELRRICIDMLGPRLQQSRAGQELQITSK